MAVTEPRARVVMFRISDTEYETIAAACRMSGARSFSDFARTAVLSQAGPAGAQLRSRYPADLVSDLALRVGRLEERLQSVVSNLVAKATRAGVPG